MATLVTVPKIYLLGSHLEHLGTSREGGFSRSQFCKNLFNFILAKILTFRDYLAYCCWNKISSSSHELYWCQIFAEVKFLSIIKFIKVFFCLCQAFGSLMILYFRVPILDHIDNRYSYYFNLFARGKNVKILYCRGPVADPL